MPESRSKRSRYTPPAPKKPPPSPLWVPAVIATSMLAGVLVVITNYLGLLPGGSAQNPYLFLGLTLISLGFVLATQYR